MKKLLTSILGLSFCFALNAQNKIQVLTPAPVEVSKQLKSVAERLNPNAPKTITCNDTLHYPLIKEQVIGGGNNFYNFEAWASDNEAISQAFEYSGSSMSPLSVKGVQIYGRSKPGNAGPVALYAAVFNVDANMNPTGSPLQWGQITVSDTNFSMRTIILNQPATVLNNYAIVVSPVPTAPGNIFEFYVTDVVPGQPMDENLSRFRSNYYPSSNGNFVNIPTLTASFTGGPYDFEAVMAPIVSYTLNANFSAMPSPACEGTPIVFNNSTSPMYQMNHRMYNYQAFQTYFNSIPDSTFAWDLGTTPPTIQWGAFIAPYTYTTPNTYTVTIYALGGLVGSCLDTRTAPVTVNPTDDATFNYSSNTLCLSGGNQTPTVVTPGGSFSSSPSGMMINPMTGEIDMSSSTPGTYTVVYTTSGICPDTYTQTVTLTTNPSASFTYPNTAICSQAIIYTPAFGMGASAGVFSATPSGLTINPSNGEVNIGTSTPGTYTITNFIAASGGCPSATHNESLTIHALPTISVTPSSPSFCSNDSSGVSLVASGASTYSWSPATGLSSTSGASVAAFPTSTTTYSITGTDANGCSNTANVTVTVNTAPTVTFTLSNNNACINWPATNLTGGSPSGGTYSGPGVSGGQFNPSVAGIGTHTITYTYTASNGCSDSATQTITVNACTGIEESSIANSLLIAPNPAKDQLMISFYNANSSNVQLNIISADGKLVYSENAVAASQYVKYLDVTSFAKGLYFIQIVSEEGMINNKIIVQ